jgi:hypothetical protein
MSRDLPAALSMGRMYRSAATSMPVRFNPTNVPITLAMPTLFSKKVTDRGAVAVAAPTTRIATITAARGARILSWSPQRSQTGELE